MKLVGVDFETTGTDPARDRIIEIGAVLWDTETRQPLSVLTCLVKHPPEENVVLSPFIQQLTKIRPEDIAASGLTPVQAFTSLLYLLRQGDYVVAHNGNGFDRLFYEAEVARLGLEKDAAECARPWLDTCFDVPYPSSMIERNLESLCARHGIVNDNPQNAAFDALAMLRVLSHYDIQTVIARSKTRME